MMTSVSCSENQVASNEGSVPSTQLIQEPPQHLWYPPLSPDTCETFYSLKLWTPLYFRAVSICVFLTGEAMDGCSPRCYCSVPKSCLTLWPMDCSTPGFPVLHYLLKFAQTHVHGVSDATQPSHPLPPSSPLSSVFPSIRVFFQWVHFSHQVGKYWCFSFSISPSNEYSGFISFRIDWLDPLAT